MRKPLEPQWIGACFTSESLVVGAQSEISLPIGARLPGNADTANDPPEASRN
jgi:hypothetical protein